MRKYLLYLILSFISLTGFGQILQEGFNDITTLTGWTMTNQSAPVGTTGWFQGGSGTTFAGHEGGQTSYIGANFNNTTGGTGTISNWLITPTVNVKDGDVISFYTRTATGSTWADRLQVRLSQGATFTEPSGAEGLGSFTTLLQDINPTLTGSGYPQTWTEVLITVSGVGTTPVPVNVGLRYYVTLAGPAGTNSNFIGVDTFYIGEDPGTEEPTEGSCDLEGTTVGGPTWDRPLEGGGGMSAFGEGVTYHVYGPFTVDAAGSYEINSTQEYDGFIFLYSVAFDPENPLTNYVAGDDDGPGGIGTSQIITNLSTGTEYFLITTGYSDTDFGTFVNTITGPGTVTCDGGIDPPGEGCFVTGTFDQWPSNTVAPACLGLEETITTAGWAGEFSKVQVSAGVEYTFSSSVPTDFITIADEDEEITFTTGTGSVTWTSPVDQVIRFYTHLDEDCTIEEVSRSRIVLCGEPVVIEEPDFPCFQGDGLASNGPEDGLNISPNTAFRNADDFIVEEAFTVQQVRLNILSLSEISEITLNFRADNAGSPGDIEETVTMAPSSQRIVGSAFGFNAYEVTLDLATPFEFGAGTYWLQPEAVNQDPADGSIYWEATSTGSTGAISQTSEDSGASWTGNEFGYQLVFFVAGQCGQSSNEDCDQGDDSNAFENGYQIGMGTDFRNADDFNVSPNNTLNVTEIEINVISMGGPIDAIDFVFYNDNSGAPGSTVVESVTGLTPASQEIVGNAFGFDVYQIITEVDLSFTGGASGTTYWMHPTATAAGGGIGGVFWEISSVGTLGSPIHTSQLEGPWTADADGFQAVFKLRCDELAAPEMQAFDFAYYPNPVKDELNITSQKLIQSVSVYNLAGQQVSTQKLNLNNGKVSTSALNPGVYVFRAVLEGGQIETFKVIKK